MLVRRVLMAVLRDNVYVCGKRKGEGDLGLVLYITMGATDSLQLYAKLPKSAALSTSCWTWQACCRDYLRTLGWECCSYYTVLLQAEKARSQIFHPVLEFSVASTANGC